VKGRSETGDAHGEIGQFGENRLFIGEKGRREKGATR